MFLIFHVFQCFSPYSTSYSLLFSFSMIFTFPFILQVLQCAFLIFHDFECFSPYSWSYSVHFSFSTFLSVSNHVGGPTLCVSHFPWFSVFSPYSRPTVCISHFSRFSVFLAIFHVLQCVFLIFHDFQFSCHTPCPTVCIFILHVFIVSRHIPDKTVFVSHFSRFSVFLPYSSSYSVPFSFSTLLLFLDIFQVKKCLCLFFFFTFFSFFVIFQFLKCAFLIFHVLNVSHQTPDPNVCISLFSSFSVFLAVFHVL